MARHREWTERFLSDPPVSFTLDGKAFTGIPASWAPSAKTRRIDAAITERTFAGQDPVSGIAIRIECVEYADFPVTEWTAWFTNTGRAPSPLLSDVQALDALFDGTSPLLWSCNGDFYSGEGYAVQESALGPGETRVFSPSGGRPCDHAFPYFRIVFKGCGLSLAIGWPAQWSASFKGADGSVRVTAGQAKTQLRLMSGETIRTPRITIMSWTGDSVRAANLWRQWYRAHLLPRSGGRPLGPLVSASGTDEGEEFTAATEANQARFMERWIERGVRFDVWWIDAGWYPCFNTEEKQRRWTMTGTWKPDPERFPRGLGPVSKSAARHGARLLVWFEPERVRPGTALAVEHPDWLLGRAGSPNSLLNLGNPECRRWLTEHICRLVRENGISIYRQDFNFEPLEHWRTNEPEDRQGINENLHVQGYLQYWDDLLARNPGLWIDSCASGGRRNDLETLRRSVPLHYTDFGYGDHPVKLSFHHVLFEWIPYFKETTLSWDRSGKARYNSDLDSFAFHCGLGPMIAPAIDIARDDYDFELARRMLVLWRKAAELMIEGDYYPLTPIHRSPDRWVARQFDCPGAGSGFVQAIRLPACPQQALSVQMKAVRDGTTYSFDNPETGEHREMAARDLARAGFTFSLPPRAGALWLYRAIEAAAPG
ncbi:MAG TPA: alpha-galactosidase [Spirochaetia bacterium]|nr:alpha-galactosidase [Spirochaetia bacterium]